MHNQLRQELEPRLDVAESRYSGILQAIMDYAEYADEQGEEEFAAYKKLEAAFHQLTGKNMAKFNLWEWWEEEGAEVLAFRIALPDPIATLSITRTELTEIVRRLKTGAPTPETEAAETSFEENFKHHLDDYYHALLKMNFRTYSQSLFNRQKDRAGNYFEFSTEEIAGKIWGNQGS